MGLFHNKDQYQGANIYSMKKYVNKKRIVYIVIVCVLIIIFLGLIGYYLIDTKMRISKSEQYEKQILEISQQLEAEKQILKEKQAKTPVLTEQGKENIKHIYSSEVKRVFLTFDDGPSNNTNDILNILKEKNIKSTFFVLGSQVEKYPDIVKNIYNQGSYIANHGYSHVYSNIYSSPEEVLNEYNRCNQLIINAIGNPEYNSHLFRFPGGSYGGKYAEIKNQAISLLDTNNILYVDWNALTGDSEKINPTEEYLMNNLQKTTNEKNSVVILMHDSQAKRITVDFLPKAIEYLQQQGYEFQNFYDIVK